ncbi:MAG TPA: DMT family transporter, partial [Thermoanaerobaculia bacterium]|nr:DMT family transporter [Thermoanaerobaculia bacterium]
RNALEDAPPLALLFWRFLLAAVLAAACVARRPRPRAALRDGLVLGAILALGMSLQVVGQADTTASKAAFLTGLAVVLTPFVAVLRTRRMPSLPNGIGIALASVGFLLLTLPAAGGPVNRGDLFVFACGVVFAFYGVELAERGGRHDALWLTAIQMSVTAAVALALSLALRFPALASIPAAALEARPLPMRGGFLLSVVYLGSVCTVLAFIGWTWSQGRMSAVHGAIILALEPVFAALFAAWLLHERLGPRGFAGGALVLAGIAVSEIPWRQQPR